MVAGGTAYDLLTTPVKKFTKVLQFKNSGEGSDLDLICEAGTPIPILKRDILSNTHGFGAQIDTSLGNNIIIKRNHQTQAWLKHHQTLIELHPGIFTPITITVNGIKIPVVRPQTLFHLLKLMHGDFIRKKDQIRAIQLKTIFENYPLPFDEQEYTAFNVFQKAKMSYPITGWILRGDCFGSSSVARKTSRWMKEHLPGGQGIVEGIRHVMLRAEGCTVSVLGKFKKS